VIENGPPLPPKLTVDSVMLGTGVNEGSTTGVALITTGPPLPLGVNVIEVEGLGSLNVPPDELQNTVFGTPFVTSAMSVTGRPVSTVLGVLLYVHSVPGQERTTLNAPYGTLKSVSAPPPEVTIPHPLRALPLF